MNLDGNTLYSYGDGAMIAIVAIITVFAVLLLIIVLTDLITKFVPDPISINEEENVITNNKTNSLDVNDEDALVACLVASIDYRNEVKKNIQVVSVREVK